MKTKSGLGWCLLFWAVFFAARSLHAGPNPGIYVSDSSALIERFDAGGHGTLFANDASVPEGLAFDAAGNLYAGNYNDGTITKFSSAGVPSLFATNLGELAGLAFDANGNLFAADGADAVIWKVTPSGSASVFAENGLQEPVGIAFDPSGNLYVADLGSNAVFEFSPTGVMSVFTTNVNTPLAPAFDSAGNLYVSDLLDSAIIEFGTNGVVSSNAYPNLHFPGGVAFDSNSNLYAANNDGTVAVISPGGGTSLLEAADMTGAQFAAAWPIPSQLVPTNGVPSPTLTALNIVNNQFQFTVQGVTGVSYIVQRSTNLASTNWLPVLTNAAPFNYVESNVLSATHRFYRAVSP